MNNKGKTKESKKKKPSLDLVAVVVSFISLLAALGILWIIKRYKLPDDAVIVALIFLLPILIYLIGTLAKRVKYNTPRNAPRRPNAKTDQTVYFNDRGSHCD